MQAEILFRPLASSDYDQVISLWQRCEGVEVAEGDDRASFDFYLRRNPGLSFVASLGREIVGATLCGHDGRRGLFYHLAVAPEHRGQGVGRKILQQGLAGLRAIGISRATILVATDNPDGRAFWVRQGFEEIAGAIPLGIDIPPKP